MLSLRPQVLDAAIKFKRPLIRQCAWCLAVEVDGEYKPAPAKIYHATHGICPSCFKSVMRSCGHEVAD